MSLCHQVDLKTLTLGALANAAWALATSEATDVLYAIQEEVIRRDTATAGYMAASRCDCARTYEFWWQNWVDISP